MFSGAKEFLQGDFWIPLSFMAIVLLVRAWKQGDVVEAIVIFFFYALIMGVTKGPQILSWFGWFLRLWGFETGL